MTDLDKLNSIIIKAQMVRKSVHVTPNEFMLSDLVEALAHELKLHVYDPDPHPFADRPHTPLHDKEPGDRPHDLSHP